MKTDDRLLREYVRQVLVEDDGYGDLAMSDAAAGPYGVHYGSGDDLYKIFVKPFADVVQTAAGKTKEMSSKTQSLMTTAFETMATTLIPVLRDSYGEIFAKEKQNVDKIRQEYAAVYQTNWDAFKDNDILCAAFAYSPAAFITAGFAKKSPKIVAAMLSVITGGSLDPWLSKVKHKFGWDNGSSHGNSSNDEGPGMPMEGTLHEDGEQKKPLPDIGSVLSNKKVLARINDSLLAKKMEKSGQAACRKTLEQVFKQASGVLKANSLQDLEHKTGIKPKGMEKLQGIPEQERRAAEQMLLQGARKSMKEFYVKNLEGQVKAAIDAGVPESHPYVSDYRSVIQKIKSL